MKIQNERERERINKVKKEYRNIVKKTTKWKKVVKEEGWMEEEAKKAKNEIRKERINGVNEK